MADNKNFPEAKNPGLTLENLEKLVKEGLLTDLTLNYNDLDDEKFKAYLTGLIGEDKAIEFLAEHRMYSQTADATQDYVETVLTEHEPTDPKTEDKGKEETPGPDTSVDPEDSKQESVQPSEPSTGDDTKEDVTQPETTPSQDMGTLEGQVEVAKTKSSKSKK